MDEFNKNNKKKRDGSATYKTPKSEIYRRIALMIQGESTEHVNLKERFLVTYPEVGSQILIEEYEPGLARVVNYTHIISVVLKHLNRHVGAWKEYCLDVDGVKKAVSYWAHYTTPVASPKMIAERSDPELAFHRLPWDFTGDESPTPFFDDFLSRCTNQLALKCFLGSLFDPLADRSQYVWIYGEGGDGKGTLTTMLNSVFGPVCCNPGVPNRDARFWSSQLHKKRLAIISECEDAYFLKSALFKALTGNDAIQFENKGEKAFSEKPTVRFLFCSNNHPEVNRGADHKRRLISVQVSQPKLVADGLHSKDSNGIIPYLIMNAEWWKEAPAIINKCLKLYRNTCPTHGPIPVDADSFEAALQESEIHFDGIFWNHFEIDKDAHVLGSDMESIMSLWKLNHHEKINFRKYLERCHGLKKVREKNSMIWKGLRKLSLARSIS